VHRASLHELSVPLSRKVRSAREILWALVYVSMLSGVLACAAGTPAPTISQLCVPGDQKACACPSEPDGVQVCADDGARYGACACTTGSGGRTGTTGTGGTIGGSGGAPGMGGHGSGGTTTDAGSPSLDGSDASTPVDAPAGTGGAGATDAGGVGGAPAADGGVVDGAGVADGAGAVDAPGAPDAGAGGGDAATDAAIAGVLITPGPTGLVLGSSNTLGVQGPWYSFSDGVGVDGSTATGICEARGLHTAAQCSSVTTPAVGSFPNTGGKMCTSGKVAMVIAAVATGLPDYANITGAGIGLDLNNSGGAIPVRGVFNATVTGVTGVAFDLDVVALPGLRVEFPTPTTEGTPAYWGANPSFANSPAVAGTNVIRWPDVRIAGAAPPAFDPTMIESILFHVPTTIVAPGPYSFCVSNLRLLTN
jgi:hypothetical protein